MTIPIPAPAAAAALMTTATAVAFTTLALVMLFWPLLSKLFALMRTPKVDELAAQRPVD